MSHGGFDVDGGVGVSVKVKATDRTPMRSFFQGLPGNVSATATTRRPAISVFIVRTERNIDREASAIDLFKPAFGWSDARNHGIGR